MDKKEIYKLLNKKKKPSIIKRLFIKFNLCLIFFISLAILCKTNDKVNNFVSKYLFNTNFSFTKVKGIYDKYLGGVFPIESSTTKEVFNEQLIYDNIEKYKDGAMLSVSSNYLVPSIESGLVVFVGEKEGYGNTVIVETEEGVDIWYGNLNKVAINLYDYIEKGSYIGDTLDNKLYLVFYKDGTYLDYEKELS